MTVQRHPEGWDGTQSDFERRVREDAPAVYRFFLRMGMRAEDAEDQTQETFVKVWRWLDRYDARQAFRPWVFTIARNTAIDFFRKQQKTPLMISDDEETAQELPDTQPLPDELVERGFATAEAEKWLSLVDAPTRSAIVLHDGQDLTFQEIADISKESVHTVKSRYRRGLQRIQDVITGKRMVKSHQKKNHLRKSS